MVTLVERMPVLNKRKHSGEGRAVTAIYDRRNSIVEHSSTLQLEREIASTHEEMDGVVYELYGITDGERKLIEEA